jgi:hypothetical protein
VDFLQAAQIRTGLQRAGHHVSLNHFVGVLGADPDGGGAHGGFQAFGDHGGHAEIDEDQLKGAVVAEGHGVSRLRKSSQASAASCLPSGAV